MHQQGDYQQSTTKFIRRTHLAHLGTLAIGALAGAGPVFAEKKKKLSGGLVGENPNAAQDLFTAKFQQGLNKRTNRLFGCQVSGTFLTTCSLQALETSVDGQSLLVIST